MLSAERRARKFSQFKQRRALAKVLAPRLQLEDHLGLRPYVLRSGL